MRGLYRNKMKFYDKNRLFLVSEMSFDKIIVNKTNIKKSKSSQMSARDSVLKKNQFWVTENLDQTKHSRSI